MSNPLWPDIHLKKSHPGTLEPSSVSTAWVSMGQPGDPIQYMDATGNDWVNEGGNRQMPAYRVDALGMLHLRGQVKKTDNTTETFGSPIFTLPAGLRVSGNVALYFIVPLRSTTLGNPHFGHIIVYGAGSGLPGQIRFAGPHDVNGVTELSLASVKYLVDA